MSEIVGRVQRPELSPSVSVVVPCKGVSVSTPAIFSQFEFWRGSVPSGFFHDPLGVLIDLRFTNPPEEATRQTGYEASASLPALNEEIFEWIGLLESVHAAKDTFTMIEAGAGYGRWLASAAKAAQQRNLALRLIGIEAEPIHFAWMAEHLRTNGIDPAAHELINAPLAGHKRAVHFLTGHPWDCYGQAIVMSAQADFSVIEMEAITLAEVLAPLPLVDLIDMDIQGAELETVAACPEDLDRRVRRIHIGTHGPELEEGLRDFFGSLGWRCLWDFSGDGERDTPYGRTMFHDGVQSWVNPRL